MAKRLSHVGSLATSPRLRARQRLRRRQSADHLLLRYGGRRGVPSGQRQRRVQNQIERSLETTSFAQIAGRICDVTFGGGLAMSRIDCDQTFCPQECGL